MSARLWPARLKALIVIVASREGMPTITARPPGPSDA